MLLNISLNNCVKEIFETNIPLNTIQNDTNDKKYSLTVNLEPKQTLLNKETIVQLQEIKDYSILQISSKKEKVNFNGTPCLEWLKSRDDKLYNDVKHALFNGFYMIKEFNEIVERNKNNDSISHRDWKIVTCLKEGFENGLTNTKIEKNNSLDPVIHKVLDFITPKTLQRIEVLKQYLSTKTKEPEILFELKNVDVKETLDIATTNDNSCKKADDLLNFLVKDLEWYKWFLENKKQPSITYSLQYLQLTRSITHSLTINETMQVV